MRFYSRRKLQSRPAAESDFDQTLALRDLRIADNRPEVAVQRRLLNHASNSFSQHIARFRDLAATSPLRKSVVQRGGGDEWDAEYGKHKDGNESSKWDNATGKKEEIWKEMERDDYQEKTKGFLGAEKDLAVPTTHHILSKSKLPHFEFNLGNLRLGPNRELRADDPGQNPDYNIGYDGELTPRSKKITTYFEGGEKEKLKEEFEGMEHRKHTLEDFEQWYISKEHWDVIAEKWEKKDEFWKKNKESYLLTDYTMPVEKRKEKSKAVFGIPWSKTKDISQKDKEKFSGLKSFISRGGQVKNKEQKEVILLFGELKAIPVVDILEMLGLKKSFDDAVKIKESDIKILYEKTLESKCKKTFLFEIEEFKKFDYKLDDPDKRLLEAIDVLKQKFKKTTCTVWDELIEEKKKWKPKGAEKKLKEICLTCLNAEESKWLLEFKEKKEERKAPYNLEEKDRSKYILDLCKKTITGLLIEYNKEESVENTALQENYIDSFLKPYLETVTEEEVKLNDHIKEWKKQSEKKVYDYAKIKDRLTDYYKITPGQRLNKQPDISDKKATFLVEVNLWLDAETSWIDQFQQKKIPKEVDNGKLYTLLKQLKEKYQ